MHGVAGELPRARPALGRNASQFEKDRQLHYLTTRRRRSPASRRSTPTFTSAMAIDPYSPCPGGTGKKLKFCCSDLVHDLDKLVRTMDAGQRSASLEQVRVLDKKHPGRACLQALQVAIELSEGDLEAGRESIEKFVATHPENPVALANKAMLAAKIDLKEGLRWIEKALLAADQSVPQAVYDSIGGLAQLAEARRELLTESGLLRLRVSLSGGKDREAIVELLKFESRGDVPIFLKAIHRFAAPLDTDPNKAALDDALRDAQHGYWNRAILKFESLSEAAADSDVVWMNLAILYGYTAEHDKCAAALRKAADLTASPQDALDFEVLAQHLTAADDYGLCDEVALEFELDGDDAAQEKLAAARRLTRTEFDPRDWTEAGELPPRLAYAVLDRPMPSAEGELSLSQIPIEIGEVLLYGKQTDRAARLALSASRDDLPAVERLLGELLGGGLKRLGDEQVVGRVTQVANAFRVKYRFPDQLPLEERVRLAAEALRMSVDERLPKAPLPMFGGRTLELAASEPQYRRKVSALLLQIEMELPQDRAAIRALRSRLGVPEPELIDGADLNLERLSAPQLARLNVGTLNDDQLRQAFQRSMVQNFTAAMSALAEEIVSRPEFAETQYKIIAYQALSLDATDRATAEKYLAAARELVTSVPEACGRLDLAEFEVALRYGELQKAVALLQHALGVHREDQSLLNSFLQLGFQAGLLNVNPNNPDQLVLNAAAGRGMPASPAAAEAPAAGKLWTPGEQQVEGKKSALWVPD